MSIFTANIGKFAVNSASPLALMTQGRVNSLSTFFGGSGLGSPVEVTIFSRLLTVATAFFRFLSDPLLLPSDGGLPLRGCRVFGPRHADLVSDLVVPDPLEGGKTDSELFEPTLR